MGISIFPPASSGATNNDFVIDLNSTNNNVTILARLYPAGSYAITTSSNDTSRDIYLINTDGSAVGYSNSATIVASEEFDTVVTLGLPTTEIVSFTFQGDVADATQRGTEIGAGAYLTSISPSDLPDIDDTATVIGGNFGTAIQIFFESGTVSTPAKQVARADSTALIVTRPDVLDPALDPWSIRAINPGVPQPTGSTANVLAGTVDAGALPVWVTTSPLPAAIINSSYLGTVVATDADGPITYSITSGSLPTGLALATATGVISGTPTTAGGSVTIRARDAGGNTNDRSFFLPVQLATGGSVSSADGFTYHTFTSTANFVALTSIPNLRYVVVAGGGGGAGIAFLAGGSGGAGGFRASFGNVSGGGSALEPAIGTLPAGTVTVTVGAGGGTYFGSGGASSFGTFVTTVGGGYGGNNDGTTGGAGGSGGGGRQSSSNTPSPGGTGTLGQGFAGADAPNNSFTSARGGGAASSGATGGSGVPVTILGGTIARGGAPATAAPNYGSGGGGGNGSSSNNVTNPGFSGAAGVVVVRY